MARSAQDIINSILSTIRLKQPNLDISVGEISNDVTADAIAEELSSTYTDIDNIKLLASFIVNAANISNSDFDSISSNYDITRDPGTYASGTITFGSYNQPLVPIQIGTGAGSGGIIVQIPKDSNGNTISFITTSTVYLTPSSPLNPLTGLYEVSAPIQALVIGSSSNTGTQSITNISTSIAGVNTCYNALAVVNGNDVETNSQMAQRIITKFLGLTMGSQGAYKEEVLSVSGVQDAYIVTPNNPDMIRNVYGGSIDIYILGETQVSYQDTFMRGYEDGTTMTHQPVLSISSVVGATTTIVYTQGTDYDFVEDTTSGYAHSIKANDAMDWVMGGSSPALCQTYIITYVTDGLVQTVQNVLDDPDNRIITADVLAKASIEVIVDLAFSCTLYAGYDKTITLASIKTFLAQYFNNLGLGDPVQQSDIIFFLRQNLTQIDNIFLPFTQLSRRGFSGTSDLSAKSYEVFVLDNVSLNGITIN